MIASLRRCVTALVPLLVLSAMQIVNAGAQTYDGQAVDDGFRVVVDSSGTLVAPGAQGPAGDPGDVMVVVSSCADQIAGTIDCTAPYAQYCAAAPADDDANQWRPAVMMSRRDAALDSRATGTWTCLNFAGDAAATGPTQDQVLAALDAALPSAAATTNPRISPTTGMIETLVHLPLILHYDEPRELAVEDTIAGRRVRITAYAASFAWTAGDTTINTDQTGRTYRRTAPCDQHACAGYLTAPAFDRIGFYPLTLAIRWSGAYRIDDGPPIQIDQTITRTSPTLTIRVSEARAELISGDEYR